MMDSLLELFVHVDDFCKVFNPFWTAHLLTSGARQRKRDRSLGLSEIMTILIAFHQSQYRDFKAYYGQQVFQNWRSEFPGLVSYNRVVEFIPSALIPLCAYFQKTYLGNCSGVSFINSTSLEVCLNQRIGSHKVFADMAERGKTSTGWFYGFKYHLDINDRDELLSALLTSGNIDDRKPVSKFVHKLFDKMFGDRGYISKPLFELFRQTFGVTLVTKFRSNSKSKIPMNLVDRILLRKRTIQEFSHFIGYRSHIAERT